MVGASQKIRGQAKLQRATPRRKIDVATALMTEDRKLICFALVVNISEGGAKLSQVDNIEIPDRFIILLSSRAEIQRRCAVVWRTHEEIGVRFLVPERKARKLPP